MLEAKTKKQEINENQVNQYKKDFEIAFFVLSDNPDKFHSRLQDRFRHGVENNYEEEIVLALKKLFEEIRIFDRFHADLKQKVREFLASESDYFINIANFINDELNNKR